MNGYEARTQLKKGDKVRLKDDPKQVIRVTAVVSDPKEPKRLLINGSIPCVLVEKVS